MLTSKTSLMTGVAAVLGCATLAAAAIAQPAPPPGPPKGPPPAERAMRHDPTQRLSAILQLRPNQQPALAAFSAAMRPDRDGWRKDGGKDGAKGRPDMPKTTPERLAMMDRMITERDARAHARIDATRKFYDQLDPAQKTAFDALPPMMGRHHRGEHGGRSGPDGHRGMGGPMGDHGAPPPPPPAR